MTQRASHRPARRQLRGDRIVGMLSVNATSGDVWYHAWHGRFLQVQERPAST
ncbi:hypothetical protein [Streptomyces hirsutus]|uniref:hypothetical protein n=1 Tax=Streptomyces hirsutus TaxID=35620 RepID=UPI000B085F23|nr:hypothetical protein [Streptomyces hirsutus]